MRLSRRSMLKGSALAGSAIAVPAFGNSLGNAPLVVFDSRIPESLAFAATTGGEARLDLAQGLEKTWRALDFPQSVTGLTRWSDWTALRGHLEEQGLRLEEEMRVASPLSGRTHLFRWTMTAR
ncbi:MAG: hypothetical protein B7X90_05965 [Novosphingobium sp. 17-62-19]|uniref:hypothetical protein n=1 Tax=Novosphingobium sp. 17-62-19 TaxID=1970406 RepID=UPI000BD7732C|nr:hypothetical protein [Novosphingobium sp. 17-62-19]OYX94356.1 MAG: hypothetical protein B7Y74_07270 [Novosphingobium sp. 35-62-5]OZA20474.1 MAG: hypothetical protein B7X90_05965 [Novosphingobium sp. 17-62-19]HQS97080.1 hypothetical protein [Novosphingobium sp.]